MSPAIHSAVTPFVAATIGLTTAARRMSVRTSRTRSSAGRRPARRSSVLPTTASSVFPTAITAATGTSAPLVALARKAAAATAGQRRSPPRKSAAIAIPVGAQTGVTTP
jgi:hypothetical protein